MEKPCEKVYFSTERLAQIRATSINSDPFKRYSQKDLYVYKCPNCSGYHLTKNVPRTTDIRSIESLSSEIVILKDEIRRQNLAHYKKNQQAQIKDELLNDFLMRYGLSDIFKAMVEAALEFNQIE